VVKLSGTKTLSIIAGALAGVCFYVASAMLFFIPPVDEDPYWHLIVWVGGPGVLGLALIVLAAWLWSRGNRHASLWNYLGYAFTAVVGGLVLVWIVLIAIARLKGQIP
jgi:drug/metabolite transporter (DMT)-like permease